MAGVDLWRAKLPKVAAEGGIGPPPPSLAASVAAPLEDNYTLRATKVRSRSRDGSSVGDALRQIYDQAGTICVWPPSFNWLLIYSAARQPSLDRMAASDVNLDATAQASIAGSVLVHGPAGIGRASRVPNGHINQRRIRASVLALPG
ncbi:hypothetical protein PCASD_02157 [Puccinia coronata f. sp. avenae]|uniref:Uncharacterized protein n=1 Tax=Puccinia coronata f. sp. avenae TaxID=200324 RepID=A0A2N5VPV3_9BASI|nr:hypothetical protein PCASD_02157 [Puccinia coronata f. sp. avenae]